MLQFPLYKVFVACAVCALALGLWTPLGSVGVFFGVWTGLGSGAIALLAAKKDIIPILAVALGSFLVGGVCCSLLLEPGSLGLHYPRSRCPLTTIAAVTLSAIAGGVVASSLVSTRLPKS